MLRVGIVAALEPPSRVLDAGRPGISWTVVVDAADSGALQTTASVARTPSPARVAVLGMGRMGAALAGEYARAGHDVRVTSSERMPRDVALARVGSEGVSWSGSAGEAAAGAHLVVESLPEELELKQRELARAQEASPRAILATNTSSLRIGDIAAELSDPSRLLGTHFFNPPSAFSIVELIAGAATDPAVTAEMVAILRSLGREPIRVGDVPGFVINRLQFALLREAVELVDQGVVDPVDLDRLVADGLGAAGPPRAHWRRWRSGARICSTGSRSSCIRSSRAGRNHRDR